LKLQKLKDEIVHVKLRIVQEKQKISKATIDQLTQRLLATANAGDLASQLSQDPEDENQPILIANLQSSLSFFSEKIRDRQMLES